MGFLDRFIRRKENNSRVKPKDRGLYDFDTGIVFNDFETGILLDHDGWYQEAIVYYDKALEINPIFAEALLYKGHAMNRLGRLEEAVACYDKALEINPEYAEAMISKGLTLVRLGRHQEAILPLQKFIKVSPPKYATQIKDAQEIINQIKKML